MGTNRKEKVISTIRTILDSSIEEKEKLAQLIQSAIQEFIELFKKEMPYEPILPIREVVPTFNPETHSINFGVERTSSKLFFNYWFLELRKIEKKALLYFLFVKESLMHFISCQDQYSDFCDAIINIIAILFLKEYLGLSSINHRIITIIRSRIYSKDIGGKSYHFWDTLLILLLRNEISFEVVFNKFYSLYQRNLRPSSKEVKLIDEFNEWVKKTISRGEEVIAPIFLSKRFLQIVKYLLDLGYDDSSSSAIANLMDVHENTIRNALRELMTLIQIFWFPNLDLSKINLHSYLFKITPSPETNIQKMGEFLLQNPYIQELFKGQTEDDIPIYYSSTFICPHLVSEQLREQLEHWKYEGLVVDYSLQLIRHRHHYSSVTTTPLNPTLQNFSKLILADNCFLNVTKLTLRQEQKDFSMEFDDTVPSVDYNLLYFLSIIRCRYPLKARYGVWVDEFYKLCKHNNISPSNISAQMNFINQLEIRARRKKLLHYSLTLRSFSFLSDVLVIEIPLDPHYNKEKLLALIDRLRVFSWLAVLQLYDRWLISLPGISCQHPIAQLLKKIIQNKGFLPKLFTINSISYRPIPYHKLYNFDSNKWLLKL
ncbi:MAG: hypothetical protein GF308_04810 [Candidatus Heimdallarchaeota archaeon]|nr:hypothetical protein [Candidatus Heimdallarchaeota archaeon]